MFTVEERGRVRAALIELAQSDRRVVAGAEVGSLSGVAEAAGLGDRWSDLDLTFGLEPGVSPVDVLDDWAVTLRERWGAVRLFDLQSVETLYRVFLFPGWLQVDLSATPGGVSQMGPKFRMLFGDAVRQDVAPKPVASELYGLCVHHALRTRVSIERGRMWAAEFWVGELRHEALSLAALVRGLPARYARSFHELPEPMMELAAGSLASSVERGELLRALAAAVELLVLVAADLDQAAMPAMPAERLRDLAGSELLD